MALETTLAAPERVRGLIVIGSSPGAVADQRAGLRRSERLRAGEVVALVSDAGTPMVNDPGFVVARAVIAAGLPVHPVARVPALPPPGGTPMLWAHRPERPQWAPLPPTRRA